MENCVIHGQCMRLAGWRSRAARPLCGAALAFLILATQAGCTREEASTSASNAQSEVEVRVTQPILRELPRTIRVTGTLHGDEETTIAAKVAGRIMKVYKDLGDAVPPGEALLQIDPTDYELARAERERAFVEALAELGLNELPPADFSIDKLPTVERAQLQADNAKQKHERARQLAEREPPLISEQDFADLRTAWDVAQSNLKVERLLAESTLAEARTLEAQVRIAEQRVRDAVHRAPEFDSTGNPEPTQAQPQYDTRRLYEVAMRMVTVGDFVQIGAPLMRLVDADPLKLRANVPERRLGAVQIGQSVQVHIEAFQDAFGGEVSRVSPAIDTATRAFPVEIRIDNSHRKLKPGSFATAEIEVGIEQALMVPESAIVTFAGVQKLLLVQDGKSKEQRVELGKRAEGLVEIRSGLKGDEQVILRPPASLGSGAPVRIIANQDQASAGAQSAPIEQKGATP